MITNQNKNSEENNLNNENIINDEEKIELKKFGEEKKPQQRETKLIIENEKKPYKTNEGDKKHYEIYDEEKENEDIADENAVIGRKIIKKKDTGFMKKEILTCLGCTCDFGKNIALWLNHQKLIITFTGASLGVVGTCVTAYFNDGNVTIITPNNTTSLIVSNMTSIANNTIAIDPLPIGDILTLIGGGFIGGEIPYLLSSCLNPCTHYRENLKLISPSKSVINTKAAKQLRKELNKRNKCLTPCCFKIRNQKETTVPVDIICTTAQSAALNSSLGSLAALVSIGWLLYWTCYGSDATIKRGYLWQAVGIFLMSINEIANRIFDSVTVGRNKYNYEKYQKKIEQEKNIELKKNKK